MELKEDETKAELANLEAHHKIVSEEVERFRI